MKFDNVIVVVRSAGERTIEPCHKLLLEMFPKPNVIVISEVPFSKAVEKSLEIGISSGKDWLACIDADVIISKEQTIRFLNYAQTTDPSFFCVQSLILDKFFSIIRPSGIHLYRIKLCSKAINLIPKEGLTLRPESFLKQEMALLGYPTQQSSITVGIHDFEQFYRDIYRKCFLQAHKHRPYVDAILPYWREQSKKDYDYQMAIYGAASGKAFVGVVEVSKSFLQDEIIELMEVKGIREKATEPILLQELINNSILNALSNPTALQEYMFPKSRWNETLNKNSIGGRNVKSLSRGLLLKKTGNALVKLGKWIYNQS